MLDADVHEGRGYGLYRYADEGSEGIFRLFRDNDKGKHDDGRNPVGTRSVGVVLDLELTKVYEFINPVADQGSDPNSSSDATNNFGGRNIIARFRIGRKCMTTWLDTCPWN